MDREELNLMDYLKGPIVDLKDHPDFSADAMVVAFKLALMTSAQLEDISTLIGDYNG